MLKRSKSMYKIETSCVKVWLYLIHNDLNNLFYYIKKLFSFAFTCIIIRFSLMALIKWFVKWFTSLRMICETITWDFFLGGEGGGRFLFSLSWNKRFPSLIYMFSYKIAEWLLLFIAWSQMWQYINLGQTIAVLFLFWETAFDFDLI